MFMVGGVPPFKVTDFNAGHSAKALFPILFTVLGIVIEVKPAAKKVFSSMLVILLLSGKVNDFNAEHKLKALSPIFVTVLGMAIEGKDLQELKAPLPMLVTVLGIVTEFKA